MLTKQHPLKLVCSKKFEKTTAQAHARAGHAYAYSPVTRTCRSLSYVCPATTPRRCTYVPRST